MDEFNEHIERLKEAIREGKRLWSELKRNVADMNRIIREIKRRAPKKPKSKNSNRLPKGKQQTRRITSRSAPIGRNGGDNPKKRLPLIVA
jgi:hypothetical protein